MSARRAVGVVPNPVKYSDGMVALSNGKAALWLLAQIEGGHLLEVTGPLRTPTETCGLKLDTKEARGWLTDLCLDTIAGGIRGAEAAFLKPQAEQVSS